MPWMAAIAIGGGLLSAYGATQAGDAAKEDADFSAQQLEENAGQSEAAGQQAAIQEQRKTDMIMSRMIAVAAASGAGATDPTVVKLAAGVKAEGELASETQMYNANSAAYGMRKQAAATRRSGIARQNASRWQAAGSLLSAGYSAFGGGSKPKGNPNYGPE